MTAKTVGTRGFLKLVGLSGFLTVLLLFLGQGASADGPFTPTFSITVDEVAPDNPDILPADDECPVGAACKYVWRHEIPDGQPSGHLSGIVPSSIVGFPGDALVPDGAIVGRLSGSTRVGPVGSCPTQGTIVPWEFTWFDATTDVSTTTGSQSDLCSFSNWPTQLNGVKEDFLAANPGAVLRARWVGCSQPLPDVPLVNNVLLFTQTDGSILFTVPGGDPTAPVTGETCGPMIVNSVHLGLSRDNPDTPADEGGIPLRTCTAAGTQTFSAFFDRQDTPPGDPVVLDDTGICSPNTPTGNDVSVPLNGGTEALAGIDVTFSEVTGGGTTTVITTTTGPPPPTGFKIVGLAELPLYFDISTDTSYSGDVTVCVRYDDSGLTLEEEGELRLMQNLDGDFVDRTISRDPDDNIICGTASSFSVWAVMAPIPVGGIVELAAGPSDPAAGGSDPSARDYAGPVAAAVAAGAVAIAAGGWYARRRWLR